MKVGIINVPRKVGPKSWAICFTKVADRSDVFGINETVTLAQKDTYLELAKDRNLGRAGLRSPNPVFWKRAKFHLDSRKVHPIHPAGSSRLARRYPGYNSARTVTEVVLTPKNGGPQFAVLCSHWVPEGKKVPGPWRAWARHQSKRVGRDLAKAHLAQGRPVWFIADTNLSREFAFKIKGAKFQWLKGRGIDKVGLWVPLRVKVKTRLTLLFSAPTDHRNGFVGRAWFPKS